MGIMGNKLINPFNISDELKKYAGCEPDKLLELANITKPPVIIDDICKLLNIKYHSNLNNDYSNVPGYIKKHKRDIEIWINPNDVFTRRRFTLAHEFGHLFLHVLTNMQDEFIDEYMQYMRMGSSVYEIQANQFAAKLLMPSQFVNDEIVEYLKNKESITAEILIYYLSNVFQVSEEAMKYRLLNLSILKRN